jgi:hypothetical protein
MRFGIAALVLVLAFIPGRARAEPRFEIGPQLSISNPTGDASWHMDSGFVLGLTGTYMQHPVDGFGLDLLYHGWPRPETMVENWEVSRHAFQSTVHVKLVAPVDGPAAPWIKAGVGNYLVFDDYPSTPIKFRFEPGYFAAGGVDIRTAAGVRFGFDVAHHHVWSDADLGFDITSTTIGLHLLIGPR